MTVREKGVAAVTLLGLNAGLWAMTALGEFSPLLVVFALVFGFLSAGAASRMISL